jgi:hypothetical protein
LVKKADKLALFGSGLMPKPGSKTLAYYLTSSTGFTDKMVRVLQQKTYTKNKEKEKE